MVRVTRKVGSRKVTGLIRGSLGLLQSAGVPSWVMPGAIFDEDFANQLAYPRPYDQEMIDTRASQQYVTNANGLLVPKASGILSISDITLLVEPVATSLVKQSNTFSDAAWGKTNSSVSAGGTGPDGNTATRFMPAATSAFHLINQSVSLSGVAALAIYGQMAPGGHRYLYLGIASAVTCIYDLQNGVVTSASGARYVSSGIQQVGSWYRCWFTGSGFTGAITVETATCPSTSASYDGTASPTGSYMFGASVENTTATSSYIATAAAAATRAANNITLQRTGVGRIVYTFDDNSQQTVSGINTGAQYTLPTNLNRPLIKRMTGYAA